MATTTMSWQLIVLVFAVVFLALAAFKTPEHPRVSFGWLGMFLWLLVEVFSRVP